ncbi:MAG: Stp1/IreP family PP2C-type Ser/Thr phosphatase [Defluviitaleaceae bacterium]|nr:Stp1/IreP family PP2C-type Ser/Thr phosphatase [Defluviitaleaceae bacterium]
MYYAAGSTDSGIVREQNQDAIFVNNAPIGPFPNLFIVADGMGGHNAGEVASRIAVEKFSEYIRNFAVRDFIQPENYLDLLVNAAQHANAMILEKAAEDSTMRGMGTTLSACVITDDKIFIAHIGDSRIYATSHTEMKQLTTDHTFVEELLRSGNVSPEEARNHPRRHLLTRVLGIPEDNGKMEVDTCVEDIGGSTAVLLSSDGFFNMVTDDTALRIINGVGYVETRVRHLVEEANKGGGRDNISVILIDIGR